jgi:hypothetical protein
LTFSCSGTLAASTLAAAHFKQQHSGKFDQVEASCKLNGFAAERLPELVRGIHVFGAKYIVTRGNAGFVGSRKLRHRRQGSQNHGESKSSSHKIFADDITASNPAANSRRTEEDGGTARLRRKPWRAGFSPREALASLPKSSAEAPLGLIKSALQNRRCAQRFLSLVIQALACESPGLRPVLPRPYGRGCVRTPRRASARLSAPAVRAGSRLRTDHRPSQR